MLEQLRAKSSARRREMARLRRGHAAARRARVARTATPPRRPHTDWSQVVAGPWLAETLEGLRSPEGLRSRSRRGAARHAAALPAGRRALASPPRSSASAPAWPTTWAWARPSRCWRCCWCSSGRNGRSTAEPSLLVAPASLLANWTAEIERFAPALRRSSRIPRRCRPPS